MLVRKLAAAIAGGALLAGAGALPASAASESVTDSVGDAHRVADITKITVKNGATRIKVKVTFARLTRRNWTVLRVYVVPGNHRKSAAKGAVIEMNVAGRDGDEPAKAQTGILVSSDWSFTDVVVRHKAKEKVKFGKNGSISLSAPRQFFSANANQSSPTKIAVGVRVSNGAKRARKDTAPDSKGVADYRVPTIGWVKQG